MLQQWCLNHLNTTYVDIYWQYLLLTIVKSLPMTHPASLTWHSHSWFKSWHISWIWPSNKWVHSPRKPYIMQMTVSTDVYISSFPLKQWLEKKIFRVDKCETITIRISSSKKSIKATVDIIIVSKKKWLRLISSSFQSLIPRHYFSWAHQLSQLLRLV